MYNDKSPPFRKIAHEPLCLFFGNVFDNTAQNSKLILNVTYINLQISISTFRKTKFFRKVHSPI